MFRLSRSILCAALADAGRTEEAAVLLGTAAAEGFSSIWLNAAWALDVHLSTAARELQRPQAAATLYQLLLPYPDAYMGVGAGWLVGHASTTLGLLAATVWSLPAAEAHFAYAAERLQADYAPILLAQATMVGAGRCTNSAARVTAPEPTTCSLRLRRSTAPADCPAPRQQKKNAT